MKQFIIILTLACSALLAAQSEKEEKDPVYRVSLNDLKLNAYEKD